MNSFYTLCPEHPECGCNDASECSSANPKRVAHPVSKRLSSLILAALLPLSIASVTIATAIASTSSCAHAGQCGECYDTGRKGINVWRGKYSDCDICETVEPELTIASHDGLPGGRVPKRQDTRNSITSELVLAGAFDPPKGSKDGAGSGPGGASRHS